MKTRPTAQAPSAPASTERATGISNRATAREEEADRQAHPPVDVSRPPEDAAGRIGDAGPDEGERQTSHKAGSRSIAQKEDEARYPDRGMPASKAVPGAFGREPTDEPTK